MEGVERGIHWRDCPRQDWLKRANDDVPLKIASAGVFECFTKASKGAPDKVKPARDYRGNLEDKRGQHSLKINYLRNCKGRSLQSNILQIQNLTLSLTDDCRIVPRGCYLVKKKTSDIKANYFVSKPPILNKNGTEDFCKAMGDSKFQSMAAQYKSLDTKCPIEAGQYCISKGSTVVSQLNPSILNMATGNLRARVEMESDKGKQKSCVEMEAVISKKH